MRRALVRHFQPGVHHISMSTHYRASSVYWHIVPCYSRRLRSVGGQRRSQVACWRRRRRLVLVAQLPGPLSVGRGLSLHVPRARPTARTARFHRLPTATRPRRPDTYTRTQVSTPVGRKWNGGGCFFVKKWTFPRRRVHHVQYQYFLFYILLIWGCIRAQRTPLPTGLG